MIRVFNYHPAEKRLESGGPELIEAWAASPDALLWADFGDEPLDSEQAMLIDRFGLHPLAVSDAQRRRHPPKFERFGDHSFLLLRGLDAGTNDVEFGTLQIALFVGARFLVSRHRGVSLGIDNVCRELREDPAPLAEGTDLLALRIARRVADRYLPILLDLETRLDQIEDEMRENPNDRLLNELVGYVSNLKKLKRIAAYHVQALGSLSSRPAPGLRPEHEHEQIDVYEHLERVASLSNLLHDLAADLIDGYISVASHRLNQIMKVLTIVTAIFVPLGFLAGIYGMNFDHMPELHTPWGYYGLLTVMGLIAAGLLLVFKRKRWL
jgi:magnesium transporter